ncbi:hypothetical protein JDV02_009575 [Purpureocillium takamizusanense]|uniref:Uncharacterized protein n=1 Tax=Purpureocillium takamizusanense TaxID=2060973 RepID=A0A9Q8QQ87_9HYPO|nr:uncharacterized protein JDV02_009575 [Purpureocillium takamizusanense]UNI23775.1 hypothetical protein JDV02_009575 [Purpureocillium takamizusanense]
MRRIWFIALAGCLMQECCLGLEADRPVAGEPVATFSPVGPGKALQFKVNIICSPVNRQEHLIWQPANMFCVPPHAECLGQYHKYTFKAHVPRQRVDQCRKFCRCLPVNSLTRYPPLDEDYVRNPYRVRPERPALGKWKPRESSDAVIPTRTAVKDTAPSPSCSETVQMTASGLPR